MQKALVSALRECVFSRAKKHGSEGIHIANVDIGSALIQVYFELCQSNKFPVSMATKELAELLFLASEGFVVEEAGWKVDVENAPNSAVVQQIVVEQQILNLHLVHEELGIAPDQIWDWTFLTVMQQVLNLQPESYWQQKVGQVTFLLPDLHLCNGYKCNLAMTIGKGEAS